jgi:hypothetical protein
VPLALGTQSLPLGGGCSLYLNGALLPVASATNSAGFATLSVPIGFDPGLRGVPVYVQAIVLDPAGAFAGLAFTAGLGLGLGD